MLEQVAAPLKTASRRLAADILALTGCQRTLSLRWEKEGTWERQCECAGEDAYCRTSAWLEGRKD